MSKRSQEQIDSLADLMIEALVKKCQGELTAADIAQIRGILKDAGIQVIPSKKATENLVKSLPFDDEDSQVIQGNFSRSA